MYDALRWRAMEESNFRQRFWRPQLCHLTNRPFFYMCIGLFTLIFYTKCSINSYASPEMASKKSRLILPSFDYSCKIAGRVARLKSDAYFLASLNTTCLRSLALYFLSSILRSTSFLFLRVQYVSPVDLFFIWMSLSCRAIKLYKNWINTL